MSNTLARQRQLIGTTNEWGTDNLVIGKGEIAVEVTAAGEIKLKVGDGAQTFSNLAYISGTAVGGSGPDSRYLAVTGGNMTGDIVFNSTAKVTGLATNPSSPNPSDATSYQQVVNMLGGITGADFRGAIDLTQPYSDSAFSPTVTAARPLETNDWVVNKKDGLMHQTWIDKLSANSRAMFRAGTKGGTANEYEIYVGDDLIFAGAANGWHFIAASALSNKYISKYGDEIFGKLRYQLLTSAPGVKPEVYTGAFDVSVSSTDIITGTETYPGSHGMLMDGPFSSSFVETALRSGTNTSRHKFIMAGNGSLRLPVTATSFGSTSAGNQIHLNPYTEVANPHLAVTHRNATDNFHTPFEISFRNRGNTGTSPTTWQGFIKFTTAGRIELPTDVSWTYGSTSQRYQVVSKKWIEDNMERKGTAAAGGIWSLDSSTQAIAYTAGQVRVPTTPTLTNSATSKSYVDGKVAGFVNTSGGTMTGAIVYGSASFALDALVNRRWVEANTLSASDLSLYLKRDGTSPMTGNLNMGSRRIIGLANATNNSDAPTWLQVKNLVGGITGATFRGAYNIVGSTAQPATREIGDWIIVSADGQMNSTWWGRLSTQSQSMFSDGAYSSTSAERQVRIGDDLIWDGSKWHYIRASADSNKYVSRLGDEIYGPLRFRIKTNAASTKPDTYAGAFDIKVASGTITSGGTTYTASNGLFLDGPYSNGFIEFAVRDGSSTARKRMRYAPNGSLRIPHTNTSATTSYGYSVNMNVVVNDGYDGMFMHYRYDNSYNDVAMDFLIASQGSNGGSTAFKPISPFVFKKNGTLLLATNYSHTYTGNLNDADAWTAIPKRYADSLYQRVLQDVADNYVSLNTTSYMNSALWSNNIIPNLTNRYLLGNASYSWTRLYVQNSPNVTSDRSEKRDIADITGDLIDTLKPVVFRRKDADALEFGFIAQDSQAALDMTYGDHGLYSLVESDDKGPLTMQISQIIAPLVAKVQELSQQLEALKNA